MQNQNGLLLTAPDMTRIRNLNWEQSMQGILRCRYHNI